MASDWQKAQSFTTRLDNIARISQAHARKNPNGDNDANIRGRQLESLAFKEAASLEEYDGRIARILQELGQGNASNDAPSFELAYSIAQRTLTDCKALSRLGGRYTAAPFKHGLFSIVYVAQQNDQGQPATNVKSESENYVAVKATQLDAVRPPHDAAREVRIMRLAEAAHVMAVLDSLYDGKGYFMLVMPFMPYTLEQLLKFEDKNRIANGLKRSKYEVPKNMKRALRDMFNALRHIHGLDIIHRDVKPSNILLVSPDGPAFLSDFGIAWCATDGASEPRESKISDVGTTCYRAAEILFGDTAYDYKLDMWAAGCVVAEAVLAGSRTLFNAGDAGSELTLIMDIFQNLGTPNDGVWPQLSRLPDWGKMHFKEFTARSWDDILPDCEDAGRQLVSQLVRYSQAQRLTAAECLDDAFFKDFN